MPLYEYRCEDCGGRFDRLQSAAAGAPSCPTCGSASVRRLISLIAGLGGNGNGNGAGARAGAGCGCGGACACGR